MCCSVPVHSYHTRNQRSSFFLQALNYAQKSKSTFLGSLVSLCDLTGRPVPLSLARSPTTIRRNGSQKPLWVVGGDEVVPKWYHYDSSTTARVVGPPTNTVRANYWEPISMFFLVCFCLSMPTRRGIDHKQIPNRQTGTI